MAPRIFITGATGYIGGDTLHALYEKHPEYSYSALVRSEEKGQPAKKAFPNVRLVIGDLDNSKVLEEEAAKADIVIHTADASDHEGAARAIAQGLASGHSKESPGFWLHTGGTGILCWEDSKHDRLGERSDKEYNDWTGVDELTNLPDEAFHRNVDKIVLEAGTQRAESVRTAIVCPPTIYGKGRGPSNTRSRQAYELAKLILTAHYIPIIGSGKARWNSIHVADLADVFVLLTEAAVSSQTPTPTQNPNPSATQAPTSPDQDLWGAKGYYLVENGEHVWADLARLMGKKAHALGLTGSLQERSLEKDKAIQQAGFEAVSWGLNSRGKAERARRVLGWKPHRAAIEDEVEGILRDEKGRVG
ncbi:NAD(P)-binding protein [Lophiostoma macrostomum CBS 122681]|uniref:NAD(P)-binding protein n=1 Tax=Lophiostoma macrostomum CBS 122681 TaxID=1314788 RepID=A0A6A6T1Y7_9PLEO|nr:NAD(P)-binding protein [Lophiostoma macrostomum CBS 122681]